MTSTLRANWERPLLISIVMGLIFALTYLLLRQFLVAIVWAGILVYVTWPVYTFVRRWLGSVSGSIFMTTLLFASVLVPFLWLLSALQRELSTTFYAVSDFLRDGPRVVPETIARIPTVGPRLQEMLDRLPTDWITFQSEIISWIQYFRNELAKMILEFGRLLIMLVLTVVTSFFLYRDGESLLAEMRQGLHALIGERADAYFMAVGNTTKAVLYGLLFAAIAQGIMSGIGYWLAGLQAPLLLATFTTLIAMLPVPFGTPLVWSSIGLWLIAGDRMMAGFGLLVWGALVVSWIDNLVRPLVISGTARVHFLLVLFGIIGGLTNFGLVGLFVGPALLATVAALWRQWLADNAHRDAFQNFPGGTVTSDVASGPDVEHMGIGDDST